MPIDKVHWRTQSLGKQYNILFKHSPIFSSSRLSQLFSSTLSIVEAVDRAYFTHFNKCFCHWAVVQLLLIS